MKKTKNLTYLLWTAALVMSVQFSSHAQTTMSEFLSKWDNGRQLTLEVVDKMPDNLLAYKPHDTAMSFADQVVHLSAAMAMISQRFLDGQDPGFALDAKPASKEEIKAFVNSCYDYAKNTFTDLSEAQLGETVEIFGSNATRRQIVALIDDHTTHHRGAAISYIRANGMEPPAFRAF